MADKFTWIDAYEAIANKVYSYRDRRDDFLSLFCDIFSPDGSDGKVKFPANGGGAAEYLAIDPFTFFASFNRGRYSEGNNRSRTETIGHIFEGMGIDATLPSDYDGVPLSFSMRTWFFDSDPSVIEDGDVDRLWDLFVAAIDYADSPSDLTQDEFVKAFDAVRVQKQVKWNITYALFWIRPHTYLGLDSVNRDYLNRNYGIKLTKQPDGMQYLEVTRSALEATRVDIPTLSDNAFVAGGWWPAREVYQPNIDTEKWLSLLDNRSVFSQNNLTALARLMDNGGKGSCTALAERYGESVGFYVANISTPAEKVAKVTDCDLPPDRDSKNSKWWPILCEGKYVGSAKTRRYEYRLRPELQEALKQYDLSFVQLYTNDRGKPVFNRQHLFQLIDSYKTDYHRFRGSTAPSGDQESYKWSLAKNFHDNWNIEADDFAEMMRKALRPASVGLGAVLGNGWEYPYPRLEKCAAENPDAVRGAFRSLFDPSNDMRQAYESFDAAMGEIMDEYNDTAVKTFDSMDQKPSAVSVYLAFMYPERYYIYKPSIADDVAKFLEAKLSSNPTEKFYDFEALCDEMLTVVLADSELVELNDSMLTEGQRLADPNHHMLVQDITYYCHSYMGKWQDDDEPFEEEDSEEESPVAPSVEYSKNLILYGPPGTGKTYQTKAYAVAICDGKDVDIVLDRMNDPEKREEVYARYRELRTSKRIGFTTFHQSFGYEDFIEGIRPNLDDDGTLGYTLREGVFREFCREAENMVSSISASEVPQYDSNPNPRVWKMGLTTSGVPDLYERCRKDGCLRLGWDDIKPDDVATTDDIKDASRKTLSAFQDEMQPGDFVVSPGGSGDEYGVAVVTGDFEWKPELQAAMRYRSAKWIGGIKKSAFREMNGGKGITLQTIYELSRISASQLVEELGLVTKAEVKKRERLPYVFIIDEINRGSISKIFGELITLLEPSKRKGEPEELSVTLPYSGREFSVPTNVYVIGTMNTADRSIALMDTALRRRFDFEEVMPDSSLFSELDVEGVNVAEMLDIMNKRIELLYDREHTLGHAIFMDLKESATVKCLQRIFENKVMPLLQEYFYDDYSKIASVLGAASKDFIEVKGSEKVFWSLDDNAYGSLRFYKLKSAPDGADAYRRIYQLEGEE